ncbi:transmembrane protein 42a isoform X3 [Narcine bancroftii]|uniref:transmembrane protein 42a isoform X3 n=1 Tax=Narcine bancroftii TaxID=1343680 RepID=UPI003831085B
MARKIGHGAAMALGAGLFGALAATAAKLSLGGERMKRREIGVEAEGLHLLLRVGCGGLVFLCNALMWTFFAKSLRYSSSAQASLTTNASNFLLSADQSFKVHIFSQGCCELLQELKVNLVNELTVKSTV